jgi:sugar diacid utilization regulator
LSGAARGATLFLVPDEIPPAVVERLRELANDYTAIAPRIGLGPVAPDLPEAGRCCRRALAAVDTLTGTGLAHYDDVLVDVLFAESGDVSARLLERFSDVLGPAPHLAETISSFFDTDMSIRDTAAVLHVHPNTVTYRLGRLHELSGLDPRLPRELLLLETAHRAIASDRDSSRG